jgi:drug/metabolite transporter (DMT)-like permease
MAGPGDPSQPATATGKKVAAASTSEARSSRVPPTAIALIVAISLLWGLNWPAMKLVVGELSPWTFRVVCVVVAGISLLLLARLSGERIVPPRRLWLPLSILSVVHVSNWHMLTAFALTSIGGGRAAILAFTMPLWATVLGVLVLKEQLRWRQVTALGLGLGGIALLLLPELGRTGVVPSGYLLMIFAAIAWGIGTVGQKLRQWEIGILALSGWQLVIGGAPIILAWLILEPAPDFSRVTPLGLAALAYVVFVALVFCFSSYIRLVSILPANIAAISTLAIPVVGLWSSALLLGEAVGIADVAALLLVLSALALVLLHRPTAG